MTYDSTNKNCQAGDIDIVEFGHAKEDKGLPIFNYSSREIIRYMDKCGYDFVIMVKGMKAFVNDAYSDEKDRYLHVYYSYNKAAAEREALESRIDRMSAYLKKLEGQPVVVDKSYEKYYDLEYYHEGREDQCFVCGIEKAAVIEDELKMCGYFCIITSAEMTAKEALELYKSRDASEKLFKADKSFLGNRSKRIYSGESLEGKILIAFVALIIRNRMYTKLKDAEEELLEKTSHMNVPASIRELEKIEMIRQADGICRLNPKVFK